MRFHYENEGQRAGPCTIGQLRNMADFGGLSLSTRVSEEGSERWISLGSLLHSQSVPALGNTPALPPPPSPSAFGKSARAPGQPGGGVARAASFLKNRNRAVYILLAICAGLLGVHNFYAGYKWRGIAQLAITIFLGWLIIPVGLVWLWVLIEIFTVEKDAAGVPFTRADGGPRAP